MLFTNFPARPSRMGSRWETIAYCPQVLKSAQVRQLVEIFSGSQVCGTMGVATAGQPVLVCGVCGGDAVQRADDTPDAIARRLALYDEETRPLLAWLAERKLLVTIDGVGAADEVGRRVLTALQSTNNLGMTG